MPNACALNNTITPPLPKICWDARYFYSYQFYANHNCSLRRVEVNTHRITVHDLVSTFGAERVPLNLPLVYPHILCNKCFEMEDLFATHLTPMFVESCPFDDLWLQRVIRLRYEFPRERLDNRG